MRFLLISDTHIGNPCPGYHPQTPLDDPEPLFKALGTLIRQRGVDFICHAGDIIDNGSREQMRIAAEIFRTLPCPTFAVPGNHDLMFPESAKWMTEELPELFPCGTTDYYLIRDGIRFDFLTSNWNEKPAFWDGVSLDSNFQQKQYAVLEDGPQDLPRILITHSPACGVPVKQSGLKQIFHAPPMTFEKDIFRLAKEKNISLILCGHNHLNLSVKKSGIKAVTVSALREMPFEFKFFEIANGKLSMSTCSLSEMTGIRLPYDFNKTYIQGRICDRAFDCRFRKISF
ncbi:MAG: metallophosphoesterase [Lentisphaeria bacterium]|nr:metallophosphoesterase [Lentisphaeria bacterium]